MEKVFALCNFIQLEWNFQVVRKGRKVTVKAAQRASAKIMTDIKRALTVEGKQTNKQTKKLKSAVCKHRKLRRIMLPIIIQNSYSLWGLTTAAPSAGQKGQNSLLWVQPRAKTGCDWSLPLAPQPSHFQNFRLGRTENGCSPRLISSPLLFSACWLIQRAIVPLLL